MTETETVFVTSDTKSHWLALEDFIDFTFILGTFMYIPGYFPPYLSSSYNMLSQDELQGNAAAVTVNKICNSSMYHL